MSRILFVDDDRDTLELYRAILAEAGHEVETATDGVHALAILDKKVFDVLITDLVMPYIDGERLARIVRHRYAGKNLLVIALSAVALEKDDHGHPSIDTYVAKGAPEKTAELLMDLLEGGGSAERFLQPPGVRKRRVSTELLGISKDYELVLNKMTQGLLRFQRDQTVVYANTPALELLGLPEEEVIGRKIQSLLSTEAQKLFSHFLESTINGEESDRCTLSLQSGEVVARAELLESSSDGDSSFILFLTDVTAEHAFSDALQKSERGYRAIVESSADLLWTFDTEGNLTYVNPADTHFTGYTPGDYYAGGPPLLIGVTSEEELSQLLNEIYARCRDGGTYSIERELPTKSGRQKWAYIRITALRDDDQEFIGLRGEATNIDRRKRAEMQLRRAIQERTTLVREVHHRVKNSVQLMISMLHLKLSTFEDAAIQAASVDLENRFRVIASVYAHLYEYRSLDRLDGPSLIETIVTLARADNPYFEVDLRGDAFVLSLDKAIPLGLIVRELVANVSHHVIPHTSDARLELTWARRGGFLRLRFSDNGPGIDKTQLEEPQTLGFLITRTLTDQLEGRLEAEADGGDLGTTIEVILPYSEPDSVEETETI